MKTIRLHDKNFRLAIPNGRICDAIGRVADRINKDYAGRETPLFVGVLNGSFMFMAELMQRITLDCEASFVKIASYSGTASTGKVHELIGLSTDIRGRHVVIVEGIVDTGASIEHTVNLLKAKAPASIAVATLLFKPKVYRKEIGIDYCALKVSDRFLVGFGLDYDQLGRNLKDIYEATDE